MAGGVEWVWGPAEGEAVVVQPVTVPEAKLIECCGWDFEKALGRWAPKTQAQGKKPNGGTTSGQNSPVNKKAEPKKKKITSTKLSEAELAPDHYQLLELENEWESTEDEIARAYKKKCLETHPDKTGGDDTLFKRVQIAGDVLQNPNRRRTYDSSLPFDDSIPPAKVPAEDFYLEFGEVFDRNKKWSQAGMHTAPSLGDASTPIETVENFYTYWFNFKSWRDYSHSAAEHDLEQAEHREERRWMERENQRAVDKAKKTEMQRIITLVERAFKNDPRIKQRDADRAAEKEKIREEKRRAIEEEKQRVADELERQKKEEEERKVNRKALMQQAKKNRQVVRKMLAANEKILKVDLDWLLSKLEPHELVTFIAEIEPVAAEADVAHEVVYANISAAEIRCKEDRRGNSLAEKTLGARTQEAEAAKKAAEKVWTDEELLELQKACSKYPAGTMDRWSKLSEFMAGKKTAEQCLKKVKQLEQEYKMPQQGGIKATRQQMQKSDLPAAQQKDASLTSSDNTRQFKDAAPAAPAAPAAAADKPAAAAAEEAATESVDVWSTAQQKSLENVLRELKAYKEKDKWDKIAAAVEGKSKKQCVARYKFLCSAKAKK